MVGAVESITMGGSYYCDGRAAGLGVNIIHILNYK